MDRCTENVIEWIENENTATVTFSQKRMITKIKKLAAEHPEEVQITAENMDSSICAHIPVKWVKIGKPKAVSEVNKELHRQIMKDYHIKNK